MAVSRWIGIGLLGIVVLVAAGIAALLLLFDWNDARGFVARRATAALHRPVSIDGDLRVRLGDPIRIHAEGVRVANAEWSDEKDMASLKVLDATLLPWPLLHGDIDLPEIRLTEPDLFLEKNKEGKPNWDFGPPNVEKAAAKQAAEPDNRREMPVIGSLVVTDGRVRYRDPAEDVDIDSAIDTATGANGEDRVRLKGNGTFAGKAFTLTAEGGSLRYLRDDSKPYPLRVEAAVGRTKGKIKGTIADPVTMDGVDVSVDLGGNDLADVFPILGIPMPSTAAYALSGHLDRQGAVWRLTDMKGKVGDSDLSGTVAVDTAGERPKITADLTSNRLAARDLAGFVGASPKGKGHYPTKGPDRVLPATPIRVAELTNADMDVTLRGKRVEAPFSTLDDLTLHLMMVDGTLTADPLALGVGGGRVAGTVVLNARGKLPALRTNLDVRGVSLARLFKETRFAQEMGGVASGRIQLAGQGGTVADILADADGKLGVAIDGGRITSYAVEGLKTNILQTLGIVLSGDRPMPFNCMVGNFGVEKGIVRGDALVLDTPQTLVTGKGTINLRDEAMDITLLGRAKEPQIFATHVPVHVGGTLGNPDISVNPVESAARGAAAVALGVLLTPLASVLPFLDSGTDQQPHCGALIDQARAPAKGADKGETNTGNSGGPGNSKASGTSR